MPTQTRKCSAKYFRSYQYKPTNKNINIKYIRGYVFDDSPGLIYESSGYNKMKEQPIKIEKNWILQYVGSEKQRKKSINEYYCGNRIVAVRKTIPENLKTHKKWRTLNNGGIAFIVFIDDKHKNVEIYGWPKNAIAPDEYDYAYSTANEISDEYFTEKDSEYKDCEKIFIGKSPYTALTKASGAYGKRWDGNTILIDIGKNQYVAVFQHICKFTSKAKIVKYISEVGNNNVPYPYAIDANGNIYLIIEEIFISNDNYNKIPNKSKFGPYMDYYNNNNIGQKLQNLKYIAKI